MKYLSVIASFAFSTLAFAQLPDGVQSDLGPDVPTFKVRPGYRVTRATAPSGEKALRQARFLEFSDDGNVLFVSLNRAGIIQALRDPDANGVYQTITNFVTGKSSVHGMDFHGGWLYFSQINDGSISRARDTNGDGVADEVEHVVKPGGMPSGGGNHPFIALLVTDTQIFAGSPDPQNMTEALDSDRKTIYVFDAKGENRKVWSTGMRNTEKLRFRPGTTEIWGFDHGSDQLGRTYGETQGKQPITDLNPPEEFNHYIEGGFYGHPYIIGNGTPRPELASRPDIVDLAVKTIQPGWLVDAHWAVLGFTFLEKDYFPGHKGDVFFGSHGSWNSTKPVGAVVERVMFDQVTGLPIGSMTIVDCQGPQRRFSRPVDCAEAPDGTILFSSDEPPGLFRISKSTATPQ